MFSLYWAGCGSGGGVTGYHQLSIPLTLRPWTLTPTLAWSLLMLTPVSNIRIESGIWASMSMSKYYHLGLSSLNLGHTFYSII